MKLAIVTTVKYAEGNLNTFIKYHLSIGFDLIYLFFDDIDCKADADYLGRDNIVVIKKDQALLERWKKLEVYEYFGRYCDSELLARQALNANLALLMAEQAKIDWLLHIDVDELFYSPQQDVKEHFAWLFLKEIVVATYLNHEGIPEKMHATEIYSETRLFKKNPSLLDATQNESLSRRIDEHSVYFNFYGNGKSAARISKGLFCNGVHTFDCVDPLSAEQRITFPSAGLFPCILHYACCSFELFWRKYQAIGNFNDKWFDKPIKDTIPMHINSRDVCKEMDMDYAESFYRIYFIEYPLTNARDLERAGVYFRINLNIST